MFQHIIACFSLTVKSHNGRMSFINNKDTFRFYLYVIYIYMYNRVYIFGRLFIEILPKYFDTEQLYSVVYNRFFLKLKP